MDRCAWRAAAARTTTPDERAPRGAGPDARRGAPSLDRLLGALPRVLLVCGKGGVGKTTCAAAIARRAAASGATLLLSTDPARALGDALGVALDHRPRPVPGHPELHALQLDAAAARDAFLARWRETLVTIVDRGTYLDRGDVEGLVDAALPGADEAMALLELADHVADGRWSRVVADTAPTGHTLRLLALPATFSALIALLDAMQEKHRFMVAALTHRYRADAADAFIGDLRRRVEALDAALRDPARAAALVVTRAEPVVAAETGRLVSSLGGLGIAIGAVVLNAVPQSLDDEGEAALTALAGLAPRAPRLVVPRLPDPPVGPSGLDAWTNAAALRAVEPGARSTDEERGESPPPATRKSLPAASPGLRSAGENSSTPQWGGAPPAAAHRAAPSVATPIVATLARPLTIVGGKGGVGKTTAACAIALGIPADRRVLLVSTDPAPSVADALAQAIGDAETPVLGAPNVTARQMDAERAFARLRDDYRARVDAVFDGLTGGTLDVSHDRRVLRDLLALAPPGIDELYALASLGETLAEGRFDVVVVDPAPTGHLLRLLEMPVLALDWSHRLLRLMLKYKEIAGLGDAAAEVLAFAKRTRAVGEMLRDPARAGLVCVALDEPLVRAESERLVAAVRALGVRVTGIVWNRVERTPRPLSSPPPAEQFVASARAPAPRGVASLRQWLDDWRPLALPDG